MTWNNCPCYITACRRETECACLTYLWPSTTVLACASNNLLQRFNSLSGTDIALLTVLMADAARDVGGESESQ